MLGMVLCRVILSDTITAPSTPLHGDIPGVELMNRTALLLTRYACKQLAHRHLCRVKTGETLFQTLSTDKKPTVVTVAETMPQIGS